MKIGSFFIFSSMIFGFFPLNTALVYSEIFNKNRSKYLFRKALSSEKITLTKNKKRIKMAQYFERNKRYGVPQINFKTSPKFDLRFFFRKSKSFLMDNIQDLVLLKDIVHEVAGKIRKQDFLTYFKRLSIV